MVWVENKDPHFIKTTFYQCGELEDRGGNEWETELI